MSPSEKEELLEALKCHPLLLTEKQLESIRRALDYYDMVQKPLELDELEPLFHKPERFIEGTGI